MGEVNEPTSYERGRRHQGAAIAALDGTGPVCGERKQLGQTKLVCIMPPHPNSESRVEQWRKKSGRPPTADRHYFVSVSKVPHLLEKS